VGELLRLSRSRATYANGKNASMSGERPAGSSTGWPSERNSHSLPAPESLGSRVGKTQPMPFLFEAPQMAIV